MPPKSGKTFEKSPDCNEAIREQARLFAKSNGFKGPHKVHTLEYWVKDALSICIIRTSGVIYTGFEQC
jgi:hypothetical protein